MADSNPDLYRIDKKPYIGLESAMEDDPESNYNVTPIKVFAITSGDDLVIVGL